MQQLAELILNQIRLLSEHKEQTILIAIDGRCAAGKTTLAAMLQERCDCNVIHMDQFFLRPEQRTEERMRQPGGNVDYERFLGEVLQPLKEGRKFSYSPYNCKTQTMDMPITVLPKQVNVVEGAYSCRPEFLKYYDLKIFLSVDKEEQLQRIERRNGQIGVDAFLKKWIPLEEHYFRSYQIREQCDMNFETT